MAGLIRIAHPRDKLPTTPRHGFRVNAPHASGLLQINSEGKVINVIPPFRMFLNLHWKEVEVYCKHVPGWSCEWLGDY